MKITSIKPYVVDNGTKKHWIFVKVDTDDNFVGWGESYSQTDRETSITAHLDQFNRHLIGRDPFNIKHLTSMLFDDYVHRRGSMEFFSALSGLELALWDIVGQACGQPVHRLLGGAYREKLRVYANGWAYAAKTPKDIAKAAEKIVRRGFNALKFDPFPLPVRTYVSRHTEDFAVSMVAAVRDAVGRDIDILVETSRRLNPRSATRFALAIEHLRPYWLEEPCDVDDLAGLREIRSSTSTAIVSGETLYRKADFMPLLEARAADIINPDISVCGGLLELKEIAAMSEPYNVGVAPHNYNSTTLSLAATLQAGATMPNFLLTEYFVSFEKLGKEICENPPSIEDGFITLPTQPGLGLKMREHVIVAMAAKGNPERVFRYPADE
jgi:galactonate dehydratase